MSYPSDPTDEQWELLEPVLNAPGKRGRTRGRWVVPDSVHESRASELMLEHLGGQGVPGRLELVLVDRGVTRLLPARMLGQHNNVEVRRFGWDDRQPVFRPIRHG